MPSIQMQYRRPDRKGVVYSAESRRAHTEMLAGSRLELGSRGQCKPTRSSTLAPLQIAWKVKRKG